MDDYYINIFYFIYYVLYLIIFLYIKNISLLFYICFLICFLYVTSYIIYSLFNDLEIPLEIEKPIFKYNLINALYNFFIIYNYNRSILIYYKLISIIYGKNKDDTLLNSLFILIIIIIFEISLRTLIIIYILLISSFTSKNKFNMLLLNIHNYSQIPNKYYGSRIFIRKNGLIFLNNLLRLSDHIFKTHFNKNRIDWNSKMINFEQKCITPSGKINSHQGIYLKECNVAWIGTTHPHGIAKDNNVHKLIYKYFFCKRDNDDMFLFPFDIDNVDKNTINFNCKSWDTLNLLNTNVNNNIEMYMDNHSVIMHNEKGDHSHLMIIQNKDFSPSSILIKTSNNNVIKFFKFDYPSLHKEFIIK